MRIGKTKSKTPSLSNDIDRNAKIAPSNDAFTIHQVATIFQMMKLRYASNKTYNADLPFELPRKCSAIKSNGSQATKIRYDQPISGHENASNRPEQIESANKRKADFIVLALQSRFKMNLKVHPTEGFAATILQVNLNEVGSGCFNLG